MRVLLALGGNAMTNADGRARPEDQIAAAEVAIGLGLIVAMARRRVPLDVDQASALRG